MPNEYRGSENLNFSYGSKSVYQEIIKQSPFYDRDPRVIGSDIAIREEDLSVSSNGDIETITGVESIIENLLRRMTTPINGYARWIRTANGLEIIDEDFGNGAYSFLSTPITKSDPSAIKLAVLTAASQETRIVVNKVEVVTNYKKGFDLFIDFFIKGNEELQSIQQSIFSESQ